MNTLKTATLFYIGTNLVSKNDREALANVFKMLDKNKDGVLSKSEIKEGYLQYFGRAMSDEEIDDIFNSVDADKNGSISYHEFIVSAINRNKIEHDKMLEAAFDVFDRDKNGKVEASEIKNILSGKSNKDTLPSDVVSNIIKAVDANGDGVLSKDEFIQMIRENTWEKEVC